MVTFSSTGVSFDSAPDHFATNGFDHIEPYVSRLLEPATRLKSVHLFTPDGNRGFCFAAQDGMVKAGLTVEWRQEAEREKAIRAFFGSRGIAPTLDSLVGNGGGPDAIHILEYPISGSTAEVTSLTKRILQESCDVAPTGALDIKYNTCQRHRSRVRESPA